MPTAPKGWSIENVDLMINGINIDGFGESGAIRVTPRADLANYSEGQDGEGVFSYNPSRAHDITITLRRTSSSQNIMQAAHAISDALTGTPIMPVVIVDRNTGSMYMAVYCSITKLPEIEFAREVSDAEWGLVAADFYRADVALDQPFIIT